MKKPGQPSAWPCAKTGGKDAGPGGPALQVPAQQAETAPVNIDSAEWVVGYKFPDGTINRVPTSDVDFQLVTQYVDMARSENTEMQAAGRAGIERLHDTSAKAAAVRHVAAQKRSALARHAGKAERPNGRTVDPEEIAREFDRLRREGFTARQARGKMRAWDRWSDSSVTRYAKEK